MNNSKLLLSPINKIFDIQKCALAILNGANKNILEECVEISLGGFKAKLNKDDYSLVCQVVSDVKFDWEDNTNPNINERTLEVLDLISKACKRRLGSPLGKKKILMLKDRTGCGYWRMVMPSKYLNKDKFHVDITEEGMRYDEMIGYDTVMIMRCMTWQEHAVIDRLKKSGVRIVYDIDDNIFEIPEDNPAAAIVGNDQKQAAASIMEICDIITTTNEFLANKIKSFGVKTPIHIIPNSLDVLDGWPEIENIGSPDNRRRIFWQGSSSHAKDWSLCITAIDRIMKKYPDVVLSIFGYFPEKVNTFLRDKNKPWWNKGRIEYANFTDTETYFSIIKHIRAECGVIPLIGSDFSACKSNIKWMEYALVGVPSVASNVVPYNNTIEHGKDGYLCNTEDEWFNCIEKCLVSKAGRTEMIKSAREKIYGTLDINKNISLWEDIL